MIKMTREANEVSENYDDLMQWEMGLDACILRRLS